jgi:hypothetical protein
LPWLVGGINIRRRCKTLFMQGKRGFAYEKCNSLLESVLVYCIYLALTFSKLQFYPHLSPWPIKNSFS